MPVLGNIEVSILSNLKPLKEHQDPTASVDEHKMASCYIEVEDGMRFMIQTKLLRGFDFHDANYVQWSVKLDNSKRHYGDGFERGTNATSGLLRKEKAHKLTKINHFNEQTDNWEYCPLAFGDLAIGEFSGTVLNTSLDLQRMQSSTKEMPKIPS